jgi:DNA-binding Lrp family transcriptional regulator
MDEKDEAILTILRRRSGLSSRALSNMLNIPISTVHRRIKRLEKQGIIVGYRAIVNFEPTIWPIGAFLLINLSEVIPGKGHIPKNDILRSLSKYPEIDEIIEVQAATFDIVVKARFRNLRALSDFLEELRSIEGIEETTSAIITDEAVHPPSTIIGE